MQNGLIGSPQSPLPSTDSHCTKDGKEPDELPGEERLACVSIYPAYFLTAWYVNFLRYVQSAADREDLVDSLRLVIL